MKSSCSNKGSNPRFSLNLLVVRCLMRSIWFSLLYPDSGRDPDIARHWRSYCFLHLYASRWWWVCIETCVLLIRCVCMDWSTHLQCLVSQYAVLLHANLPRIWIKQAFNHEGFSVTKANAWTRFGFKPVTVSVWTRSAIHSHPLKMRITH